MTPYKDNEKENGSTIMGYIRHINFEATLGTYSWLLQGNLVSKALTCSTCFGFLSTTLRTPHPPRIEDLGGKRVAAAGTASPCSCNAHVERQKCPLPFCVSELNTR